MAAFVRLLKIAYLAALAVMVGVLAFAGSSSAQVIPVRQNPRGPGMPFPQNPQPVFNNSTFFTLFVVPMFYTFISKETVRVGRTEEKHPHRQALAAE